MTERSSFELDEEQISRDQKRRLFLRLSETFRPPPRVSVSEWADDHRVLAQEETAQPGRWRTEMVPYLREIMDQATKPGGRRVVFMKSAQIGGTEALKNVIAYHIAEDPCPILVVQTSVGDVEKWSKRKLAPMIRATPRVREAVRGPRSRSSTNTIREKTFPGGALYLVGANAPSGLRAEHIRVLLCDDVDGFPASAGTEGDPVRLAEKRTETYWNSTTYLVSTPTRQGFSRIEDAFHGSDQRHYHVPCPHCGLMQKLRWAGIQWEGNDASTARYLCGGDPDLDEEEGCGVLIEEARKAAMVRRGEWRASNPGASTPGYHINALYSPFKSWPEAVREWQEAQGNREKLRVFVNTVLGETWEESGETVDDDVLASRREPYPDGAKDPADLDDVRWRVPSGVGVLTAGVDVQGDRLELLVKGWGRGEESWQIAWEQIHGDPGRGDVWEDLDWWLRKQWRHESGGRLPIACTMIDSGGHHAEPVYQFCKPRTGRHVHPLKGMGSEGRSVVGRPSTNNSENVKLFPIGTHTAKDLIFSRLKIERPGPGYIHFPAWLSDEYFKQLTAEKVVTKYKSGVPQRTYQQTRPRNEALDLEVYALAALYKRGSRVRDNLGEYVRRMEEGGDAPADEGPKDRRSQRRTRSEGVE